MDQQLKTLKRNLNDMASIKNFKTMTNNEYLFSLFKDRIIENPFIDCSQKVLINNNENFTGRYIGTLFDRFFKEELIRRNHGKIYHIYEGKIVKCQKQYYKANLKEVINSGLSYTDWVGKDKIKANLVCEYLCSLIMNVDFKLFKAKDLYIHRTELDCGINFRTQSIKPDLIIDNKLIDIKAYDNIRVEKTEIVQLVLYAIWLNYLEVIYKNTVCKYSVGRELYQKQFKITEICLFFAKHNYLWKINFSDIVTDEDNRVFLMFITKNRGAYFKKEFISFVKQYVEKRFSNFKAQPAKQQPSLFTHPV